jgi:hypothetical protein
MKPATSRARAKIQWDGPKGSEVRVIIIPFGGVDFFEVMPDSGDGSDGLEVGGPDWVRGGWP